MQLAIQKIPIEHAIPGEYVALNVSGIGSKEVTSRRLGLITGYLNPETLLNEKNTIPKPNAIKHESAFYPCSSFYAQMLLFGLPATRQLRHKSEMVFHCHNSQSLVSFKEISRYGPIHKYDTTIASYFSDLPIEIVHLIFLNLSETFICGQLPQVSKYFFFLSTHPSLWQIIHSTPISPQTPLSKLSIRDNWKIENMKKTPLMSTLSNGSYLVKFQLVKPLALDTHDQCPKLGRFVLREGDSVVGGGLILQTLFT